MTARDRAEAFLVSWLELSKTVDAKTKYPEPHLDLIEAGILAAEKLGMEKAMEIAKKYHLRPDQIVGAEFLHKEAGKMFTDAITERVNAIIQAIKKAMEEEDE